MTPTVAIIAQGAMGAAVAKRLNEHGVRVLTSLDGRSAGSAARAAAAGMQPASPSEIAACDVILSIVPPNEAVPLAQRLAPALAASNARPVYVDCNAISPETAVAVGAAIEPTGCPYVDAGIIGGPPRAGYGGPAFYYCGSDGPLPGLLNEHGLVFRRLDAPPGAASALKMSYGGITKGLIAVGSSMMLAADKAGVAEALKAELAASQPHLLAYFTRAVPDMFTKAYRWVPEMEEISHFAGEAPAADLYRAMAAHYRWLAADNEGEKQEIGALAAFVAPRQE